MLSGSFTKYIDVIYSGDEIDSALTGFPFLLLPSLFLHPYPPRKNCFSLTRRICISGTLFPIECLSNWKGTQFLRTKRKIFPIPPPPKRVEFMGQNVYPDISKRIWPGTGGCLVEPVISGWRTNSAAPNFEWCETIIKNNNNKTLLHQVQKENVSIEFGVICVNGSWQ